MSAQTSTLQQANKQQASSLLRKNIRKFVNNRLAMIGLVFVVLIVLSSILSEVLSLF